MNDVLMVVKIEKQDDGLVRTPHSLHYPVSLAPFCGYMSINVVADLSRFMEIL
jgi:hypothetical protein